MIGKLEQDETRSQSGGGSPADFGEDEAGGPTAQRTHAHLQRREDQRLTAIGVADGRSGGVGGGGEGVIASSDSSSVCSGELYKG